MTPLPHAVTADQSVADVQERMRTLGVRQLPVLDGGRLVGMLRDREIAIVCQLGQGDPCAIEVGDVVTPDACVVVNPELPFAAAARAMADSGADCCAVVDHGRLAGLLTAHDVMRLLVSLQFGGTDGRLSGLRPSDVRARILSEHRVLRELYSKIEKLVLRVLAEDTSAEAELRGRCRELYQTLIRHMELEDTILAPALRDTNAFGPVRAEELLSEHQRQRKTLAEALASPRGGCSETEFASGVRMLIGDLLVDMRHEENALLNPDLLKDDPILVDAAGG